MVAQEDYIHIIIQIYIINLVKKTMSTNNSPTEQLAISSCVPSPGRAKRGIDSQQVLHRDNGCTAFLLATMLPISGFLPLFVTPSWNLGDSMASEADHVTGFLAHAAAGRARRHAAATKPPDWSAEACRVVHLI